MHARQKLTCDFDHSWRREAELTSIPEESPAVLPIAALGRTSIRGGRRRCFRIMGINHFKYATRRESARLAHRLRGKSCSRPPEQHERGLEAQGNGKMPFEFRELNPGWGRGHRCTGRTAWIECALGTFGG